MRRAAAIILAACRGLAQYLAETHRGGAAATTQAPPCVSQGEVSGGDHDGETFPSKLLRRVRAMEPIQWLVPPMLQGKKQSLQPWV